MKTILIVGGGAAGMMAAISASYGGHKVVLYEKNEKPGKKLLITGKGRCNVTTACQPDQFYAKVISNPRFLYSSFSAFNNEDMIRFLNGAGLKTKTERGMRVFPESDRASDVVRLLVSECRKRKVRIQCGREVLGLVTEEGRVTGLELSGGEKVFGDAVILACGGKSYPVTGSDGSGYRLAAKAGHRIRDPQPSLVPFLMKETFCKSLSGLTLKNIAIRVTAGKKTVHEGFGELLFTHFGVSGPLVLTASTYLGPYQKELKSGKCHLYIDFKPALDREELDRRFLKEFDIYRNKKISNVIERMLPRKLVPVFLEAAGIREEVRVREISRQDRQAMVDCMKHFPMHITGVRGFSEAIVTRGGVDVKQINPGTMESKLIKGLYFAGEMMDVDAVTGGYNLQIAWSSGYAAGRHAGTG